MDLNMNRRRFLVALSAGTAHVLFANPIYAAVSQLVSADPVQKIKLGKSGLETTLIGFGSGVSATNRSSALTRQDHDKSIAHRRCLWFTRTYRRSYEEHGSLKNYADIKNMGATGWYSRT